MDYSVKGFLEMFNNGDLEIEKFFNDYDTFFRILQSRNLFDQIDPINASDSSDWQNDYLLWLYNNGHKEKFRYWISKLLEDVVFDETGKGYLEIKDRSELSVLFCEGRNNIERRTLERILSGEGDWFDYFDDTTDDVYRDVIEELSKENLEILKKRIVEELKGQQLSPETEVMEVIASDQGHNEFWELTEENVSGILDDEESMKSLLNDELSDIKSDLYSIHSSAYNNAYEDEIYEEIFGELSGYFEGKGEWVSKAHPYKKDTTIQYFRIPFNDLERELTDYLEANKSYSSSGTLEYHGNFLNIMGEDYECLRTNFPDYPDLGKVDKNINSYFSDYF